MLCDFRLRRAPFQLLEDCTEEGSQPVLAANQIQLASLPRAYKPAAVMLLALTLFAAFFLAGGEARALAACSGWNYVSIANCEFGPQPNTCVRDFYVAAGSGGDGSQGNPWGSIQAANVSGALTGGDCVHVGPGTYGGATLNHGGTSNSPTGYITYIGAPNHASKIFAPNVWSEVTFKAPYIAVNGFDVDGGNTPTTNASSGPIGFGGCGANVHHIMVLNNTVHDAAGGGIGFGCGPPSGDYFLISGNMVYNTSWANCYGGSGISVYEPAGIPPSSEADQCLFHIVFANNVTYNNRQEVPSTCIGASMITDGNGIIVDDWRHTQHDNQAYQYQGLVQSNVSFNNGGRGIHAGITDNAVFANNVAFNNCLVLPFINCADLLNQDGNNTNWINNVAWSGHGEPIMATTGSATWTNNITSGDPMLDPVTLQPTPGSPVTAAGITPPTQGTCTPGLTADTLASLSPPVGAFAPPATPGGGPNPDRPCRRR
jgi:hypothetical protein